jgi:hypothetical protein
MVSADDVWGVLGSVIFVVLILVILNEIAKISPEISGLLTAIAIGVGLVAPGVAIALKLFD